MGSLSGFVAGTQIKKEAPTKERPVMVCCLQPNIDLYSRFELNHVLLIMGGDPLD